MVDEGKYQELAKKIQESHPVWRDGSLQRIATYIRKKLSHYLTLLKPVRLIAFLGVYGSGKSALTHMLAQDVAPFRNQLYLGWKDYFFPFLSRLDRPSEISNPSLRKFIDKIRLIVFFTILPWDFYMRYLRAKKRANYGLIIADRYPLPKDLSGGRFGLFSLAAMRRLSFKLTQKLLPRPFLVFFLTGDEEVFWRRKKQEINREKFLFEIARCKDAAYRFGSAVVAVDTAFRGIDLTYQEIRRNICSKIGSASFKIFGIRNSGSAVFRIDGNVIKIPLSLGAWKEGILEARALKQAASDPTYCSFVPKCRFIEAVRICKIYSHLQSFEAPNAMEIYFRDIFRSRDRWSKTQFINIDFIRDFFLEFIKTYLPQKQEGWERFLQEKVLPSSASHGDLFFDNILSDNQKLIFIDWSSFSRQSSPYFDLLNCYVFEKKMATESWMDAWRRERFHDHIFGIPVSRENWMYYCIWKVAVEIRLLKIRRDLTMKKVEKYKKFILSITEEIF